MIKTFWGENIEKHHVLYFPVRLYIYFFKKVAASSVLHVWNYEWFISICLQSGNTKPKVAKWPCCFEDIFISLYLYIYYGIVSV